MAVTKIDGTRQIVASSITNSVQNFGTPSATTDVAIKSYVDSVAQGLAVKPSAAIATTGVLSPSNTYATNVLTATGVGILTIDGYNTLLNDYVLVKNEATAANNGLYKVTTQGTAGIAYVLTRAVEMTNSAQFTGAFIFVEQGTVNVSSGWVQTAIAPTVGTTGIAFTQFSGTGEITVDATLTKAANQLSRAALTGDITVATGSNSAAVTRINGTALSGLATGILKNTTGTGVPSIAINSDLPVMTATVGGAVPTPPNNITTFLRGDGTFASPASSTYQRSTAVTGTQDGTNKIFTIGNTVSTSSEQVYINGQLLMPGASNDYVYNGTTTVTFQAGFTAPASTDVLRVYGTY